MGCTWGSKVETLWDAEEVMLRPASVTACTATMLTLLGTKRWYADCG